MKQALALPTALNGTVARCPGRAHACQKPFCNGTLQRTGVTDHIDHVRPHSRGGPASMANGAALDAFCNLSKADRDIAEPLQGGTGIRWRSRSGRGIITKHRRFRT
ncbi:HNH endonuclease [Helcobacillus massiliensis]|uniref:HNH endonuclease signature motif containing protein n=1 Tax=Helcobacillus TaxID=1161125 RepID=UPI001EF45A8C|nr:MULTISPECIES: HNH endonuclease signature motif containing protein [Helcobacillus]MCG7426240.1 HNH endonuclease [Helcobacillus sp. ACRRO]MCT1558581.1 HNH endonuclease [Helcobacillus massiliensis]MCT2037231.1 HNH endonuclease [Helcobacillus massiliensis]MCT2332405.1 HNH endonuclease [Helcobacillus massiliensis]MDK7742606.1 HNH endonuclease signature motif containing protein [Helcobacillus massiliensis]